MTRRSSEARLFPTPVLRGLLRRATAMMTASKDRYGMEQSNGCTLGRFAAWAAALEGAVDLVPEVVELLSVVVERQQTDTYADFYGPQSALEALAGDEEAHEQCAALVHHSAARVRFALAGFEPYRKALENDPEPSVRTKVRQRILEDAFDPPWWKGVLPRPPPDEPEVLKFGKATERLVYPNDWSHSYELVNAFRALPRDLATAIAPWFLSVLWLPPSWVEAVWEILVQGPQPLGERVARVESAVDALLGAAPCLEPAHGEALGSAVEGCPAEERAAFLPLLERARARLERPAREDRNAPWQPAPRVARKTATRSVRCPPALFERLAVELAHPGPWSAARLPQHPRARFELARGLDVLRTHASTVHDVASAASNLADLVAASVERRPTARDAIVQALAGLVRALELRDPLHAELACDPSPAVREAVALAAIGADARRVEPLLAAPESEVWMAARVAVTDAEPWRGPFVDDPFEALTPDDAAALVPTLLELARALPRIRREVLEGQEYTRLGRVAAALPGPLVRQLVPRLLPDDEGDKRMAPLVAALLAAEGGWSTWVSEVERRMVKHPKVGAWFGAHLVRFAVEAAVSPSDGGPPIPWPSERRRAAARDALSRWKARPPAAEDEAQEMWLEAATALWPDDEDPILLPGPWSKGTPPYCVRTRLERMDFRPEWASTRALMEGAREGFATPWSFWMGVDELLDRLPAALKLDAAHEGFWHSGGFGDWSRRVLADAISAARREGRDAVVARLGDPRLAPEHLLLPERTQHTLFLLRARLAAGLADLAEALLTLSLVALEPKADPWTADELAAWRSPWTDAVQQAMAQGPGGLRGALVNLCPVGLWEPLDRAFVHAVAADATLAEAQAVARRLAACGDEEDLAVARDLAERHPTVTDWARLRSTLAARRTRDAGA